MLKTIGLAAVLAVMGLSQKGSVAQPKASVTIGPVELRLNMRRDEVLSLLAPYYTVSANGMVSTRNGPPFEWLGTIGFSDSGILAYVSRAWSPEDQRQGVPTAEALYGALSQITKPSAIRNRTVQVCECTIFVYSTPSPGAEVKHIEVWDGTKTVSLTTVRGNAIPGGAAVGIDESIGSTR